MPNIEDINLQMATAVHVLDSESTRLVDLLTQMIDTAQITEAQIMPLPVSSVSLIVTLLKTQAKLNRDLFEENMELSDGLEKIINELEAVKHS